MKTSRFLPILLAFLAMPFLSKAQSRAEFFGMYSWSLPLPSSDHGWGGGLNFFYKSYPFFPRTFPQMHYQVGVGGYYSGFGYQQIGNVPLSPPQTGFGSVRVGNMHAGIQTTARFMRMREGKSRMPYLDVFGGLRGMYTRKGEIPYTPAPGQDVQSSSTLSRITGFHFGTGAGMEFALSSTTFFNCELLWSYSPVGGKLAEVSSMQSEYSGLFLEMKNAPKGIMMLKAGFGFRSEDKKPEDNSYYPSLIPPSSGKDSK